MVPSELRFVAWGSWRISRHHDVSPSSFDSTRCQLFVCLFKEWTTSFEIEIKGQVQHPQRRMPIHSPVPPT